MSIHSIVADLPSLESSPWPGHPNVKIIRGDLLHPIVSGNKLYKLLPFLSKFQSHSFNSIISVGGRYSNHLHALAWVGKEYNVQTVGLILGYEEQELTPTLLDCKSWGMNLHFVNRTEFQQRYTSEFWQRWQQKYKNTFIIKEGGWSDESIHASKLWWGGIDIDTEIVICPVGSGTTLAGLSLNATEAQTVIGVPVFKDPDNFRDLSSKLLSAGVEPESYNLWTDFTGRGFGKLSVEQQEFSSNFSIKTGIQLDPVYTAKSFSGLNHKLETEPALKNKKIAILHTGGLQGLRT